MHIFHFLSYLGRSFFFFFFFCVYVWRWADYNLRRLFLYLLLCLYGVDVCFMLYTGGFLLCSYGFQHIIRLGLHIEYHTAWVQMNT